MQMMSVDDFLGPYLPPQNLSLAPLADAKRGAEGAFAKTLATSSIVLKAASGEQGCMYVGLKRHVV
jgi:hypothetical protein